MTTPREDAERIASDDAGNAENNYASWLSNHSCGGYYGCCGGGKEVERSVLASLIESALTAAESRGAQRALKEAAERLLSPDVQAELTAAMPEQEFNAIVDRSTESDAIKGEIAAWLNACAEALADRGTA